MSCQSDLTGSSTNRLHQLPSCSQAGRAVACEAVKLERRDPAHPQLLAQLAEVLLSAEAAQQVATELPFSPVAGPCLQALLLALAADRCQLPGVLCVSCIWLVKSIVCLVCLARRASPQHVIGLNRYATYHWTPVCNNSQPHGLQGHCGPADLPHPGSQREPGGGSRSSRPRGSAGRRIHRQATPAHAGPPRQPPHAGKLLCPSCLVTMPASVQGTTLQPHIPPRCMMQSAAAAGHVCTPLLAV